MRRVAALPLLVLGTGCLSMNTFETARTLEPGQITHTMAVSTYMAAERRPNGVPAPKYGIHVGVADGFELGGHIGAPGHLRLLAKYNPLRTEYFDVAVSPGVWAVLMPHEVEFEDHAFLIGGDLPLIVDVNLTEWLTVVPWGGPGYVFSPDTGAGGAIVRTGIGIQFRLARGVRIHPELSTVIDPIRGEPIDYSLGIAVSLGDVPRFL